MLGPMAALRRLTQKKRSVTERTVLAGEASADAAQAAVTVTDTDGEAAPAKRRGLPFLDRSERAESAERHPTADDPQAAAFFDCDNTILQGAAIFYLGF